MPNCFSWKEYGGMYGTAGIPDIICCISGQFYAFEVKTSTGNTDPLQDATIRKINNCGGKAYVVRSVNEVKEILQNH